MGRNFKNLQERIGKEKLRYLLMLTVNTILFFFVYRVLISYGELTGETFYAFLSMVLYLALLFGFGLAYLIYNRFFYRHGIKREDLSAEWSEAQKDAFLSDAAQRMERSKWMLTIILPLLLTFLIDAFQLFILEPVFFKR
jgi:uncharacterized membrane protein